VRRCHIHGNGSDGLYVCWGISHSLFADNHIHHNGYGKHRNGLCTGHKDTDNRFLNNHIHDNAKHGIHFRVKTEANGAHRTLVQGNRIENNGIALADVPERLRHLPERELLGHGIYVSGITRDLRFVDNDIRETRSGAAALQHTGLYLAPGVSRVELADNRIEGHGANDIVDEAGALDAVG